MKNIILFTLIFHCALCAAQLTSAGITVTQENQGINLPSGGMFGGFDYYHHPTIPMDQKTTYTLITPSTKPIFKEILLEYEAYCNELVLDTITEYGKLMPYKQGLPDTAWIGYKCGEYKRGSPIVLTTGLRSGGWQVVDGMGNVLEDHPDPVYVKTIHICSVKRARIEPWSEHFWNWLKN